MTNRSNSIDHIDDHVDVEIAECLNLVKPKSFFLFAGAGSGKTRSLVNAINHIRAQYGQELRQSGRRIAVITYTNAACDEINRRVNFDPTIAVSTIHSFAWTVIEGFTRDIREWLKTRLAADIEEIQALEAKGRRGTKASATRIAQIASKTRRLSNIGNVQKFVYSPTGDNRGRDALSHSEVIQLVSHFIETKPLMRELLVSSFPFILVDESQDTSKYLVDALFKLQAVHSESFGLGLLGDMMQRIYSDGKEGLGLNLPPDWATPAKKLNHRSGSRIIELINKVREASDRQRQEPRSDSVVGHVRLFLLDSGIPDKRAAEQEVARQMAEMTGDRAWEGSNGCKRLILEHHMAARRMGFLDMFVPLSGINEYRTGLLDGTLSAVRLFAYQVLPLVKQQGDKFAVAKIVKESSPLLAIEQVRTAERPEDLLRKTREAVASLVALCGGEPTFLEVLNEVATSGLFEIPDILRQRIDRDDTTIVDGEQAEDVDDVDQVPERAKAIDTFLSTPFWQIEPYASYVGRTADFDTHQGVKGLEFPRVMAIMDDAEARGFAFKYEKLFGGGPTDDATTASTRRLFYVVCSRAERSLAIVAYSTDVERIRNFVQQAGWFNDSEIQVGLNGAGGGT